MPKIPASKITKFLARMGGGSVKGGGFGMKGGIVVGILSAVVAGVLGKKQWDKSCKYVKLPDEQYWHWEPACTKAPNAKAKLERQMRRPLTDVLCKECLSIESVLQKQLTSRNGG